MPLTEERRKKAPFHRHLVNYRYLPIGVMIFCGYLMYITLKWGFESNIDPVGFSAIIAAVFTPIAAIFKFALDFALDGKIHPPTSI